MSTIDYYQYYKYQLLDPWAIKFDPVDTNRMKDFVVALFPLFDQATGNT